MLQPLTRKAIFRSSLFADTLIAEMQQSYAADIDPSFESDVTLLYKYYDHLQPFQPFYPPIKGHCVMAYMADSLTDYFQLMPKALQSLFNDLGIQQLYLLDFLKTTIDDFPFKNFRKRNQLKRMVGGHLAHGGFLLDVADLPDVLPLFYFSGRYARPAIFFITAGQGAQLSLRLCKDGNFHADYHEQDRELIHGSAIKAGFAIGDIDLCWDYKVRDLPKKANICS